MPSSPFLRAQRSGQLSRRSLLKWLAGAGLLITAGCGAPSVFGPAAAPTASTAGSPAGSTAGGTAADAVGSPDEPAVPTMRVAYTTAPRHFDPARMTTIESFHLAFALYESLLWINSELGLEGLLAESHESDPAHKIWTFKLRQGIKFSNGADLLAKDVVYTFDRLRSPDFQSSLYSVLRVVQQVVALDEHTVQFLLDKPNVQFPYLLAAPQTGIVPDQATAADLASRPIGAGPFRLVSYTTGQRISMLRNPEYWDAASVSVPALEYVYGSSFQQQAADLKAGRVDILPDIDPRYKADLESDSNVTVMVVPSGRYQSIVMSAVEEPFTNPKVREAFKLCADRETLQEKVLLDLGTQAVDHPVSPVMAEYWTEMPAPEYNPAKARQLLAEAGIPGKLSLPLITSQSQPGMVELAEAYRALALPAGIEIEVVRVPPDVYLSHYAGKVPFHINHFDFSPSIDDTLTSGYHSESAHNNSHWHDSEFDHLIEAGRQEPDDQKRKDLYRRAQLRLKDHGAVIIPYFRPVLMAMRASIQGFRAHPSGWIDFYGVQIVPPSQAAVTGAPLLVTEVAVL